MRPTAEEEGGRHTPFFRNYSPQFYFRATGRHRIMVMGWTAPAPSP